MDKSKYLNADSYNCSKFTSCKSETFVIPLEDIFCPKCSSLLVRNGYDRRIVITYEEEIVLRNQRMRCKLCRILYHLIPFSLVLPGKHYCSDCINTVIKTGKIDPNCVADDSTQFGWRNSSKEPMS